MDMLRGILTFILVCQTFFLLAREPYHAGVQVNFDTAFVSTPNLVDLKRQLKTSSIQELIPTYTPTSEVAIGINLRGLLALTSFAANSTTLVVTIPNAGITQSFTGSTRDESLALFKDFIRDAGHSAKILKAYARYSPIDPIAGNPSSLLAESGQADYLLGHLSPLAGCDCCWSAQPIVHQFQAGTNIARSFSGGYDTTLVTLPLRYSYSPTGDFALILDAPFTYIRNGGASSVFGSLAMGVRLPLTFEWSLTPVFRLSSGGSLDLCTSGNFASMGLTSVYNYQLSEYVISLTNYLGYSTSANFWLSGINFNYHLHNTTFKNGLSFSSCQGFTFCNRAINFRISFEDSYIAGGHLFIRHFDQVDLALFTNNVLPWNDYDCLETSFSFQWGQKDYKSYRLNLGYQF
jgi:hypothetical protein